MVSLWCSEMLEWEPWEPRVWAGLLASRKNGPWKAGWEPLLGGCEMMER